EPGTHEERAAEGDALALPTRELPRSPSEQVADVEQIHDPRHFGAVARKPAHASAIVEVRRNAQMREQASLLKDVTDATAGRRHMEARGGIEQHGVVEPDASPVRREEPGDHVDERGLARARGAEQSGDAACRFEARRQREVAQPFLHVDREHAHSPWKRVPARRASHSATTSAASELPSATRTSRPAAASPPGTWVKV